MIKFKSISKKYKGKYVLKNVDFFVEKSNLVAIIGKSGCGKTTLLKMINRLVKPTSGQIYINDKAIQDIDEVKLRRQIGYVIQQTGLFPHMTVRQNIELIPQLERLPKEEIEQKTNKLMQMVGLEPKFLDRYPSELSGGQQQRVGVARAFANDPDIILMDEPFSALDPITRSDLQDELVHLQSKVRKTIVFVTHDMDEAIKIADMICIMKDGEILQYDTPENILKKPADNFVSDFVGQNRIWSSPEYIKVSDIMIAKPITAYPSTTILKCIERMRLNKVDSLLIIEPETRILLGITKANNLRNIQDRTQPIEQFMKTDFPVLSPDMTILDALKIVAEKRISTVPVVDDKHRLAGLITKTSLVTTLSQQYFTYDEEAI